MKMSFENYNHAKAIKDAKKVLESYEHYYNLKLSGELADLSAPEISSMPKGDSGRNNQEDQMVKYLSAKVYCDMVIKVIDSMQNENYQTILRDSYINLYPKKTGYQIAQEVGLDESQMYRTKKQALLCFAEISPDWLVTLQKS